MNLVDKVFKEKNTVFWIILMTSFISAIFLMVKRFIPYDYLALKPENIYEGKYLHTVITSMIVHANFFHLLFNMIALFFLGGILSFVFSNKKLLIFYIVSGIMGTILHMIGVYFSPEMQSVYLVGASGAVFGLAGLCMFFAGNMKVFIIPIPIPIKIKYAIPVIFFLPILLGFFAETNIANWAHFGGLLTGVVIGLYYKMTDPGFIRYNQLN